MIEMYERQAFEILAKCLFRDYDMVEWVIEHD
jgi:hypothetical protein